MRNCYFILILMLSFLYSCEGDKIDYSVINRSIKVNARIDGANLRAANDVWTEGDNIGIYMLSSGQPLSTESVLAKNAKYITEKGDGFFYPASKAEEVKFPIDGANVDFISYYPHKTISTAFEYAIDVTDQSNQGNIDLMYADNPKGLNKNSSSVDFSFSHQLSKIIVKLKTADNTPLSGVQITVKGMNSKGKFSLVNKSLTTSTKANIKMKVSDDGAIAEAILLPTEDLAGITFEIINGDYGYVYSLSSAVNIGKFESGYRYTYNITLDTSSPLKVTAAITDWTNGPSEDATVERDFKVYEPIGEGTQENPYTITDARNLSPVNGVWVQGFIVGHYTGNTVSSFSTDVSSPETIKNTILAMAESSTETEGKNTFPLQLPSGDIRVALNLQDHPENVGKEIKVKGNVLTYYGGIGMTGTSAYEFISAEP